MRYDEIIRDRRQAATWKRSDPGVKKCGTSGYGSSTLKHRDQCTAGMPENQ